MTAIHTPADLQRALDLASRERLLANSKTLELDADILAVKAKHESEIKGYQDNEKAYLALVQKYCQANRAALLSQGVKSATIGSHTIGWQDNGGAIKPAKGQTEKKVVKRLLASKGILARLFVRHTPALDKQACTAKWSRFGQALRKAGLRLVHEESFYVELNLSSIPDPRSTLSTQENQSPNIG